MHENTKSMSKMEKEVRILHLEDDEVDAELVQATLESAHILCNITWSQTPREFKSALQKGGYDLILADYQLPDYDGLSAMRLVREQHADVPFIFISGTMGEDAAIQALTEGATDYVLKQKLSRLVPSVQRALRDAENRMERRRAEEALRKNNVLLEQIFSTTEFMIAYLDADFNFIRVNRAYAAVSEGSSPEFFEGKNHFTLYPNSENETIFRKVVETGEPYTTYAKPFEYFGRPERGTSYWNWSLQPVKNEAGCVVGLVFSLIDVTEREQAYIALRQREEQLRLQGTALAAAANGFMITDRAGKIIWVNPAYTHLTGYFFEEAIGQTPRMLNSGKQDRQFYEDLWDTILCGKVWHGELVNRRKDGRHYMEEMTIAPLRGEGGDISHFIAVKQDVSERKQHELEREAIIAVANAIRTAVTRTEILTIILDQLNDLFDADGAMLAMRDSTIKDGIVIEMGRGPVGERFTGLHIPSGKGVSRWVIENRKPYLNNDAHTDPGFFRPDLLGASHAIASVPLIAQDQIIGVLWIARKDEIAENDVRLLNAIADLAANAIQRVTLFEQTERQVHRLTALHQIDIAISTNFDSNITLNIILDNVRDELEVDAACILLLEPVTHTLDYAAGIGFRTHGIEQSHVRFGDEIAGRAAQEHCTVSCPDLRLERANFGRSSLLADEEFMAHHATPLAVKGQVKGVLELFHRKPFELGAEWISYFETLATQAAIAIESASLFENLQHSNMDLVLAYDATIEGWSRALDLRDKETEGHTQRVTEMALLLADKMGMGNVEKLNLRRGALLHDIGKMGVPDSILHKPGLLSESEWEIMRLHPIYAYQMLSPISYLKHAVDIPYCHHEKWDGSGYPRGLKREEIPLPARLFAVVDVYDALTSDRPYRKAWTRERAYRYIEEQSGRHFDPQVAKIFLENKPKWPRDANED
ncbi:MAG: GAF domain-containing protein [Chloroflexi bacterium]|nr:GAF domain-containing protein [Chloroflexota bacterium]